MSFTCSSTLVVRVLPCVVAAVGLFTLVVVQIMAHVNDADFGGLTLPYVSDTGKDKPQWPLFAVGLTVTGGGMALANVLLALFMRPLAASLDCSKHTQRATIAAAVLACVAGLFLAALAWFETKNFPTLHLVAAVLFFVCAAASMTLWTVVLQRIRRAPDAPAGLTLSAHLKTAVLAVFGVAFVLYLPVGLAIASFEYDEATMLYDYTSQLGVHHMRTATQYICVVCILLFNLTLFLDFREAEKQTEIKWY